MFLVGRAHWFGWIRKQKKKKRWPRAQRYRAFSPFSGARTRPMQHVQLLRMLQHRLRQCRSRSPALPTRQRFLTLICSLVESDQVVFKVENNSLELTRIFKETLTPKRLFLSLCISISLLRPYTFFSRSPLVFKTLSDHLWFQRRRRTKLRGIAQCP